MKLGERLYSAAKARLDEDYTGIYIETAWRKGGFAVFKTKKKHGSVFLLEGCHPLPGVRVK